jgi:ribosomal protein S18 acetylase RimI-like enzyme
MSSALPNGYQSLDLTHNFAQAHVNELVELANTIPLITHTPEEIMAESKGERQLYDKWLHGLVVVKGGETVGFVGAYERANEDNEQYPENTLYISELAISEAHRRQGIATALMNLFFHKNDALGLQTLSGNLNYSVQTNSAGWNQPVIDFYNSLGFNERATKKYEDRTDLILSRP